MSVSPPTAPPPAPPPASPPRGEGHGTPPPAAPPRGENGQGAPPPGGHGRPEDFGTGGGRRSPDFDGDGKISDAESRSYSAETSANTSKYQSDSRERIAHEKEKGKAFKVESEAATAKNASNNDNKVHKMTGKQTAPPVPQPQRPT